MNLKCKIDRAIGCLTCRYGFTSREDKPCNNCQSIRNCPAMPNHDKSTPDCKGCGWEKSDTNLWQVTK